MRWNSPISLHGFASLAIAPIRSGVISDINMPNMDGLQLLAAIRATTEYRHLPVLLMSAETDELIKQHSKQLGATGWISKPFNPEKLLKAIEKVLMSPHD